ncbi:MAG: caspase family protein [Deltaproteobacteria bacterium]|nr:caspase family protein [Deltaproteobacteria bacterium]
MRLLATSLMSALLALPLAARAEEPAPRHLALVVGSNPGGLGQSPLQFAEDDARRFAEVLIELGGYARPEVRLLLSPSRAQMLEALDSIRAQLSTDAQRGDKTVFTFFYSGHARATALSLGLDELALPELRERLLAMPSTVTLAVLDACQTGAISSIKGAFPAADFSYNSVTDLHSTGAAILASSTGSELSQESTSLGGSYFTHHLLAGLRGAADTDGDGRVTLSEAYRYAYNRTLASTSATAVGRQHVTLENELKGRGEMVLTWPARATARLGMTRELRAEVLVQARASGAVLAEVSKAAGAPVQLALPPGEYVALVKAEDGARRCTLTLEAGSSLTLEPSRCTPVPLEDAAAKADRTPGAPWTAELSLNVLGLRNDAYTQRLQTFGFDDAAPLTAPAFTAAFGRALNPYLSLNLRLDLLSTARATRESRAQDAATTYTRFNWSSFGLGVFARAGWPFLDALLTPYAQVGAGLSFSLTHYSDPFAGADSREAFVGYELGAMAGLEWLPFGRRFGFFSQLGVVYAPALSNLLGDRHDSGGPVLSFGLKGSF